MKIEMSTKFLLFIAVLLLSASVLAGPLEDVSWTDMGHYTNNKNNLDGEFYYDADAVVSYPGNRQATVIRFHNDNGENTYYEFEVDCNVHVYKMAQFHEDKNGKLTRSPPSGSYPVGSNNFPSDLEQRICPI